ncbi:hypothetical protein FALBO_129 [Fusarium albosuccineum]|uniref:Uncharacterized protein n=1 Tax=Fusarium albosuccineum TaxID=1237068 RepID=A0A8H4LNP0_9HYPO|nr:hypothetical protein FALBO_129 [Fusarium albosuccineum]
MSHNRPSREIILRELAHRARHELPDVRKEASPVLQAAEFHSNLHPRSFTEVHFDHRDPRHIERLELVSVAMSPSMTQMPLLVEYTRHLALSFASGAALDHVGDSLQQQPVASMCRDALTPAPPPRGLMTEKGMIALFVAFYGLDNPVMCQNCCDTLANYVDGNTAHFLRPFATCRSLAGVANGRCCNCIGAHETYGCEWRHLGGYRPSTARDGPRDLPLSGWDWPDAARQGDEYTLPTLHGGSCPFICQIMWPRLELHENGRFRRFLMD